MSYLGPASRSARERGKGDAAILKPYTKKGGQEAHALSNEQLLKPLRNEVRRSGGEAR